MQKSLPWGWGGVWIFSGTTQLRLILITLYNDLDLLFAKLSIYGRFKCNLLLDCVMYLRAGPNFKCAKLNANEQDQ